MLFFASARAAIRSVHSFALRCCRIRLQAWCFGVDRALPQMSQWLGRSRRWLAIGLRVRFVLEASTLKPPQAMLVAGFRDAGIGRNLRDCCFAHAQADAVPSWVLCLHRASPLDRAQRHSAECWLQRFKRSEKSSSAQWWACCTSRCWRPVKRGPRCKPPYWSPTIYDYGCSPAARAMS